MKGGKDEEKMMGPLFPRLHVNDKEKGGPRAPPRNKMALYEQLSIPSQRFNSAAPSSALPLPYHHSHTNSPSLPSASSSQGGVHERSMISPFYIQPPTLAHSADKFHSLSHSPHGRNLSATAEEFDRISTKTASHKMLKNVTGNLLSTAECSLFRPHDISNSKSSCVKKIGDEDDFTVPTYVQSGIPPCSSDDQYCVDRERLTSFCPTYPSGLSTVTEVNSLNKSDAASCNYSIQLQNALHNSLQQTNSTDLKPRQHGRDCSGKPREAVAVKDRTEMSTGEIFSEPSNYTKTSLIEEPRSGSANDHESPHDGNTRFCQESSTGLLAEGENYAGISVEPRGLTGRKGSGNGNTSKVRSESCSRGPLGNTHKIPIGSENGSVECEDRASGSLQLRDVDRNDDDGSETSIVDSISGSDISPDDVVGIIGQKHFWKARRAIVNQQRVFSVQVFELHRLIKVQKLIAGSPHLLLEDSACFGIPPKVPSKELPSEYSLKSHPKMGKQKDDSQKHCQSIECPTENAVGKSSRSSLDDGINTGVSVHAPYRNPPLLMTPENKGNPWCFQPAGNQWLVPVMTPSEGLVYKPYTGPCPPTAGFMAPVYGGCGPLCVTPATGDFMNMAYGVRASHQQGIGVFSGTPAVAPNYFPPYGLPVMNPTISASAVELVNQLAGALSYGEAEQLSMGEVNFNMHSQSSSNMSNKKGETFSCGVRKFQALKDSELQGSTGSSPFERVLGGAGHFTEGRDSLTLLSMVPAEGLDQPPQALSSDQQTRVIKVVPHNPRSATESAARIFRSIQEERQQYD